jgi:hypothetical protein
MKRYLRLCTIEESNLSSIELKKNQQSQKLLMTEDDRNIGPAIEYADGTIRNLGPNTRGMIRYTYFEDYTIPPISWTATNNQLLTDYFPKASKDSIEGKLKPNQMNY